MSEEQAVELAVDAAVKEAESWQPAIEEVNGRETVSMYPTETNLVRLVYHFDNMKEASRWLSRRCVGKAIEAYNAAKAS